MVSPHATLYFLSSVENSKKIRNPEQKLEKYTPDSLRGRHGVLFDILKFDFKNGGRNRIRTCDLLRVKQGKKIIHEIA